MASNDGTVATKVAAAVSTGSGSAFSGEHCGIALQANAEKIVTAGWVSSNSDDFFIARYVCGIGGASPTLRLDTSFDGDGMLSTTFGTGSAEVAHAVAIQPDGRIVAVGETTPTGGTVDFAISRYKVPGGLEQRQFTQTDADGSLSSITDANGQVAERYLYTPYGEVEYRGGSWETLQGDTTQFAWVVLWRGMRWNGGTETYCTLVGEYSPKLGKVVNGQINCSITYKLDREIWQEAKDAVIEWLQANHPFPYLFPDGWTKELVYNLWSYRFADIDKTIGDMVVEQYRDKVKWYHKNVPNVRIVPNVAPALPKSKKGEEPATLKGIRKDLLSGAERVLEGDAQGYVAEYNEWKKLESNVDKIKKNSKNMRTLFDEDATSEQRAQALEDLVKREGESALKDMIKWIAKAAGYGNDANTIAGLLIDSIRMGSWMGQQFAGTAQQIGGYAAGLQMAIDDANSIDPNRISRGEFRVAQWGDYEALTYTDERGRLWVYLPKVKGAVRSGMDIIGATDRDYEWRLVRK